MTVVPVVVFGSYLCVGRVREVVRRRHGPMIFLVVIAARHTQHQHTLLYY
jgi:hypothetical protein